MDAFNAAQPSYISAILNPKVLADYKPKMKKFNGVPIPKWLDYCCFGPPAVRDSSPGGMALIFGRTEHDTKYYPKGKGKALRAFNAIFLICMYICFLYVPFHVARRRSTLSDNPLALVSAAALEPQQVPLAHFRYVVLTDGRVDSLLVPDDLHDRDQALQAITGCCRIDTWR